MQSLPVGLVTSLRPSQWTKNLIVFAGLLFGQRLLDLSAVVATTAAFVIFCLLSSVVYLLNDMISFQAINGKFDYIVLWRIKPTATGFTLKKACCGSTGKVSAPP